MEKQTPTLQTVADLVKLALQEANYPHNYKLEDQTDWVYDTPALGETWQKEQAEIWTHYHELAKIQEQQTGQRVYYGNVPGYDAELEAHRAKQPPQHQETTYSLWQTGGGYHSTSYRLSPELAEQVVKVWKVEKKSWGGQKFIGHLTLKGLCKRLGQNGLDAQITAAQKKEEETRARNNRNYYRREISTAMTNLSNLLKKGQESGLAVPDNTDATFNLILSLIGPEEKEDGNV